MGRVLAGAAAVAIIAAILYFVWSNKYSTQIADQQHQIDTLNQQITQQGNENIQLKTELAKVQAEEANLVAQNDALNKAIATAKVTGKIPTDIPMKLPYPPK